MKKLLLILLCLPMIGFGQTSGLPPAYLLIEPAADAPNIGTYMNNQGATWFGFTNGSGPTSKSDITTYMEYFNLNQGTGLVPLVVSQIIPQSSGGNDSFNNAIQQFNFVTTKVTQGTVTGPAWYTWLIPDESIGGVGTTNRQLNIGLSFNAGPQGFVNETMSSTFYNITPSTGSGIFQPGSYRLYTTYSSAPFNRNNNNGELYFKGNFVTSVGIEEHTTKKEILKVIDLLGRETKQTKQPLFYIYNDGTVEKRIVIE